MSPFPTWALRGRWEFSFCDPFTFLKNKTKMYVWNGMNFSAWTEWDFVWFFFRSFQYIFFIYENIDFFSVYIYFFHSWKKCFFHHPSSSFYSGYGKKHFFHEIFLCEKLIILNKMFIFNNDTFSFQVWSTKKYTLKKNKFIVDTNVKNMKKKKVH